LLRSSDGFSSLRGNDGVSPGINTRLDTLIPVVVELKRSSDESSDFDGLRRTEFVIVELAV
jgi:hypothetical protein